MTDLLIGTVRAVEADRNTAIPVAALPRWAPRLALAGRFRFARLSGLILLFLCAFAGASDPAAAEVRLRDIAGREVVLPAPARRIVVGSAMNLEVLALAHPDPVGLIVGWSGPASVLDAEQAAALRRLYPGADAISTVGRIANDTLSLEGVVALAPDLMLVNLYDLAGHPGDPATHPLVLRLSDMGVPVVIVDFFLDPLGHSEESLAILGKALGTEARVAAFNAFYRERIARIADRLTAQGADMKRPTVFLHAHAAGAECCFSPGKGALDGFVTLAGGHNIGADILNTATGQLSLEYVLSRQPDIYVGTGGYARGSQSGFTLGRSIWKDFAGDSFGRLLQRPELSILTAISNGRAHGLWHDFTHSPVHLVAIELMATWFHPELFGDLDPDATLAEINRRFLAVPMEGTFWVDAGPTGASAR